MNSQLAAPVSLSERSDILDVLRGFALLGVLLDNLFVFTGWGYHNTAEREAITTWPADAVVGALELAFVNGKFYSLFSLLFGIGFSIILVRNREKGINPLSIFYRRLLVLLLVFGLPHLLLLWEGDILTLYALIGMILPLFRKCSDKTLLTLAFVFILSPLVIDSFKVLFHFQTGAFLERMAAPLDKQNGLSSEQGLGKYLSVKTAGWQHWRNWQATGYLYRYAYILESNRIPKVLGMFLLGFYAGRKMIYARLEEYVTVFKRIRFWGFTVGIPASLALVFFEIDSHQVPDPIGLLDTLFYALSVVPLSLAYASTLCLYWVKSKVKSRFKLLAPVGRMALTNYLIQTFFGIIIYYSVGFGLGGNIGPSVFIPIGCCVYVIQIIYSNLWFRYFNYGPFEYIWRVMTYSKWLTMLKPTQVTR